MHDKHEVGWVGGLNVNVGDVGHAESSVKVAGVIQSK